MGLSEGLFKEELERTRDLVRSPDWYMGYGRLQKVRALGLGAIQAAMSGSIIEAAREAGLRQQMIFEQLLSEGAVRLGNPEIDSDLPNFDEDRLPIDRIVIHHTAQEGGFTLPGLNALEFLRLYVPRFQKDDMDVRYPNGTGKPIYSGHFDENGQQVFYPYHWLVNGQTGAQQRLLSDNLIGWHAGNWNMNCRSVAIAIDDDLTDHDPTPAALESAAAILAEHYRGVGLSLETVIGHCAVTNTSCPGNTFDPEDGSGWHQALLTEAIKRVY